MRVGVRRISSFLAVSLALSACSGTPRSAASGDAGSATVAGAPSSTAADQSHGRIDLTHDPETVFHVTWKPQTVVVDETTVQRAVGAVSDDGTVFAADSTVPAFANLQAGAVVLLSGMGLRKVTAVEPHDGVVVFATVPAQLTDAISDGTISFHDPVHFDGSQTADIPDPVDALLAMLSQPAQAAEKTLQVEGFDVDASANLNGSKLTFDVDANKQVGDVKIDVDGKGDIENFDFITKVDIKGGNVDEMSYVAQNLRGNLDVTFSATKDEKGAYGEKNATPIDIPFYDQQVLVYGLPLYLKISASILTKPALSGANEGLRTGFNISYDGNAGVQVGSGNDSSDGSMTSNFSLKDVTSVTPLAPFGYIEAMAFPRIELSVDPKRTVSDLASGLKAKYGSNVPSSLSDKISNAITGSNLYKNAKSSVDDFLEEHPDVKNWKDDVTAYTEIVETTTHIASGPNVFVPCYKTVLTVIGKAGIGAHMMSDGRDHDQQLFNKDVTEVVPEHAKCGE